MDISTKIRMVAAGSRISLAELAARVGWTPQNLNKRLKTGKLSSEELEAIARALDAKLEISFTLPDGTKV